MATPTMSMTLLQADGGREGLDGGREVSFSQAARGPLRDVETNIGIFKVELSNQAELVKR